MQETQESLGQEDPLEQEMATHSSILAWRIPRTEEPGWLPFTRSQKELDLETKQQLSNKKEWNTDSHSNMGQSQNNTLSEGRQKKCILYDPTHVKSKHAKQCMVIENTVSVCGWGLGLGGEIEKMQEQTTVSNESVHCLDSADAFTDMLKLIIVYILNMYSLL